MNKELDTIIEELVKSYEILRERLSIFKNEPDYVKKELEWSLPILRALDYLWNLKEEENDA